MIFPKQVKLCQDSFIEVKLEYVHWVSKPKFGKQYPLFVKVQIALALMTFAIVAAWWQIVLVIKRFVLICGVFCGT
jgi:hypothetical protein